MHKYHQQAETLVIEVISDLKKLLPHDGEDIACWNPEAVDESISNLIRVGRLLARANEALGDNKR